MGLAGGDNGPKAVLKRECASAFCEVDTLLELRQNFRVERCQMLAILDGNVILRGLPSGVESFHEAIEFFAWKIIDALRAAEHCVVVFDDSAVITQAKAKEQAKRDAAAKRRVPICSEDLTPYVIPTNDDYDMGALLQDKFSAPHLMATARAARPRFIDAVVQGVLAMVERLVGEPFTLAFDGVDSRGAARPVGEARVGGVFATHAVWETVLARRTPIGEGDMKFSAVCQGVRDVIEFGEAGILSNVCLYALITVDTDSYMIELLEQSRRKVRVRETGVHEWVVLCMTERARKRKGDDHVTPGHLLACDVEVLYELLVQRLFGTTRLGEATAARVPEAIMLLVAAFCLAGTDFVKLAGVRADLALNAVATMIKRPGATDDLSYVLSPTPAGALRAAVAIQRFLDHYVKSIESNGRLTKSRQNASAYSHADISKTIFNVSYWAGNEHLDVSAFGF